MMGAADGGVTGAAEGMAGAGAAAGAKGEGEGEGEGKAGAAGAAPGETAGLDAPMPTESALAGGEARTLLSAGRGAKGLGLDFNTGGAAPAAWDAGVGGDGRGVGDGTGAALRACVFVASKRLSLEVSALVAGVPDGVVRVPAGSTGGEAAVSFDFGPASACARAEGLAGGVAGVGSDGRGDAAGEARVAGTAGAGSATADGAGSGEGAGAATGDLASGRAGTSASGRAPGGSWPCHSRVTKPATSTVAKAAFQGMRGDAGRASRWGHKLAHQGFWATALACGEGVWGKGVCGAAWFNACIAIVCIAA